MSAEKTFTTCVPLEDSMRCDDAGIFSLIDASSNETRDATEQRMAFGCDLFLKDFREMSSER